MNFKKMLKHNLNLLFEGPAALAISGLVVVLLVGVIINVGATQTGATASNITNQTLQGIGNITSQYPTIGTVIAMAVILGLIFTYVLYRFFKQGTGGGI